MSKPAKKPRLPDPNTFAFGIVQAITGEPPLAPQAEYKPKKNPAAVELGRLGGAKGGKARAAKMTKKQRTTAAKKAAAARWSKKNEALGVF